MDDRSTAKQVLIKMQLKGKRPVWFYSCIVFVLSIALSLWIGATGGHNSPYIAWSYVSMLIPGLTVGSLYWLGATQRPRINPGIFPKAWFLVAIFFLPVVLHAVLLPLYAQLSGNGLPWHPSGHILVNMIAGLIIVSLLAFFEEIGWRGWLLPQLMVRMNTRTALLISACICALWHTPYDLSGIHYVAGVGPGTLAVFNFFGQFGLAIFMGWLWTRTNSIWIVCLAHGAMNNWGQFAFKYLPDLPKPSDTLWLLAGLNSTLFLVGLIAIFLDSKMRSVPMNAD